MAPLPHRIRRQRWRVRTGSPEEAFAARQQVRDELEGVLMPAFERAFDEAAPGDGVVHVSRLELHLRIPGSDALAARLPELLYQQVREQLSQAVRSGGRVDREPGMAGQHVEQGGAAGGAVVRGGASSGPRDVSGVMAGRGLAQATRGGVRRDQATGGHTGTGDEQGARGLWQLRSHYLETGSLPWSLVGLEREQVLGTLKMETAEALEHLRLHAVTGTGLDAREVAFCFRLLQLLPVEQWALVAAGAATGDRGAEVAQAIAVLSGESPVLLSRDARLTLAAVLLVASRTGPERVTAQEWVAQLVRVVGESGGRTVEALASRLPEPAGSLFRRWSSRKDGPRLEASERMASQAHAAREGQPGARSALSPEGLHSPEPARVVPRPPERSADAEPFLLPVSHAGLLLLHPYLSRFFESTGVKEAKRAELPADQLPRAAALLHLLAVGDAEVHEFELDFIKLLLGLTPDAPLPVSSGLLQPSDHEEADALLQAVIEHWKALKNTSVQGLRGSFLRRRGFVREQEHGLLLRVESQAFDVLLGAIPWGIGTVKLSWMRRPIFTEWPTH